MLNYLCRRMMSEIDDFIKAYSPEQRAEINRVKKIVKGVVKNSEEQISYGIPAVKYKTKP